MGREGPPPGHQRQTHTQTQPTAKRPQHPPPHPARHDLPWRFTWPGPRSPQGPGPESLCGLVSGSPLLPPKGPTHLAERVGLGVWQQPRWSHAGQLSGRPLARDCLQSPQAQAVFFKKQSPGPPDTTVQSNTEQIIRKPQIIPKFHPELQPADIPTQSWN